jgi:hypothetical protein
LALANETGERVTDALLHHIRGELLLKRDPANTAPAEKAFVAYRRRVGPKRPKLRAASGAGASETYQLTARPAEALAVSPAVESFSPTADMPEIAEGRRCSS